MSSNDEGPCLTDEISQTDVSSADMETCVAPPEPPTCEPEVEMPEPPARNPIEAFFRACGEFVQLPGTWVRENIIEPNRQDYPWYHQKFRRVPSIDECYTDDHVCYFEANNQYRRDRLVDNQIVGILRHRFEDCVQYETPDHVEKCQPLFDQYKEAETNWFIKYGDLGGYHNVRAAYMKQKHRMLWERRYGPVGSGMEGNGKKDKDFVC